MISLRDYSYSIYDSFDERIKSLQSAIDSHGVDKVLERLKYIYSVSKHIQMKDDIEWINNLFIQNKKNENIDINEIQ